MAHKVHQYTKHLFKKSLLVKQIVALLLFIYLKLVYITTRWSYKFASSQSEEAWKNAHTTVAVTWHDKLAILPKSILHLNDKYHILVSPHSDGIIISSVLKLLGFKIIPGSTNKNSILAVRSIMKVLNSGANIAITPDGPRGPRHKVNSNIIAIAKKCGATLIPISCFASNYFVLKSWDKLMFPLPFGRISVHIGEPISTTNLDLTNKELESILNNF